jgi:hypothetical protein
VEILRVNAYGMKLRDLADLKHYTNLKQAHLLWSDGFSPKSQREDKSETEKFLTGRLTLARKTLPSMTLKEICDFIMKLKHLTYLHIKYHYDLQCDHIKSLVDEVKAFFLPRRPNFKFYVSCCEQFELMEHVKLNCT